MSEEWKEVPIEDVKPGDVARCNGREFPVVRHYTSWSIGISCTSYMPPWDGFNELGFTFHRRVKREPRKIVRDVQLGGAGTCGVICVPTDFVGARVRVTEILDDEGNGGGG